MSNVNSIGVAGQPWGERERAAWRASLKKRRSYEADVLPRVDALRDRFERIAYGEITYAGEVYPLYALRSNIFHNVYLYFCLFQHLIY